WRKEKTHRIDRSAHASKHSSALPTTTIQDGQGGAVESWDPSRRCRRRFGAPTARTAFEHMPMMQDAVEHGGHCRHVAQQLSPILNRAVGSEQRAGALVAAHDDL